MLLFQRRHPATLSNCRDTLINVSSTAHSAFERMLCTKVKASGHGNKLEAEGNRQPSATGLC